MELKKAFQASQTFSVDSSSFSNNFEESLKIKKTLVLDLDETLIHSKTQPFGNIQLRIGEIETKIYVSKRPGLVEFLDRMSEVYTLILYTTAVEQYAKAILKFFNIQGYFSSVLHREHCQSIGSKFVKDLSTLGRPMSDIILLDDLAIHARFNPQNVLTLNPYRGENNDCSLANITEFLISVAKEQDCRPVMEKFTSFEYQKSSKLFSQKEKIPRQIETKFMQNLRMSSHGKTSSLCKKTEFNFDNIDEDVRMLPPGVIEIQDSYKILKKVSNEKTNMPSSCDTVSVEWEFDRKIDAEPSVNSFENTQNISRVRIPTFNPKAQFLRSKSLSIAKNSQIRLPKNTV